MATKQQTGVSGSVMGADDGFLFIRGLEDNSLQRYLDTYSATIVGYSQQGGEMFTNVTMKIHWASEEKEGNANLWAYFIAKAAHPTCAKPRIKIVNQDGGTSAYVTWPIWNNVKFMESKNQSRNVEF
jgi:GH24 family phage-related lysozyme (muramidase)